jgi:hypothetical protein
VPRAGSDEGVGPLLKRWTLGVFVGTAALAMTGATLVGVSSAGERHHGWGNPSTSPAAATQTIVCPDVKSQLPEIPARAQAEVDRNLTLLQTQIDEANKRLASSQGQGGQNFVQNAILGPLKDKRVSTIDRIVIAIGRGGQKPQLDEQTLGTCTVQNSGQTSGGDNGANNGNNGGNNGATTAAPSNGSTDTASASATPSPTQTGPVASDFISIRKVGAKRNTVARTTRKGSSGTFQAHCGNADPNHANSDNLIVAPGVTNGAHHRHDYVGNKVASGASSDEDLANAGTTCADKGDKSTYYWPGVRDITKKTTARAPGELESDLNVGKVLTPKTTIVYSGNPFSKVVAMPEFLRVLTGDAKAATNGGANQKAQFTCQGFTNRISTDKYTLCPGGRGFTRIHEFPSCWDGQNLDSANHRTHVVYPDAQTQACPASNPVVIPRLQITLVYNVPAGTNFFVDSFPESLHSPIADHDDFENVASTQEMTQIVNCINTGKKCA